MLANSFNVSFLEALSNTTRSLLKNIECVKQNKNNCIELMEQTHELLNAIIILHIRSNTGEELAPNILNHIGKFTETLHKIHTFVEAQQSDSRVKKFLRQGEITTLLKDCRAGLKHGLESFQIRTVNIVTDIRKARREAEKRHQDVHDMIEALSDTTSSDRASTMNTVYSEWQNSSNSISMLPSEPKIFHGRESEVADILKLLSHKTPRIAILGAGGMGKTTLAKAVVHHAEVAARYEQHRHFVACDSATNKVELAALIGAYLRLKTGKDLTKAVVKHFSASPPSLLILDNLETVWEPTEIRADIEEFLSLLTGVDHLVLMVTMRGAERPAKVRWTRPFLQPLKPLSLEAARQTFKDIADDFHPAGVIDQLLKLTDNLPLAVALIAHLVDCEDYSSVLGRWETEKTSLLSAGHGSGSDMDTSIQISLSSPRITSSASAMDLLTPGPKDDALRRQVRYTHLPHIRGVGTTKATRAFVAPLFLGEDVKKNKGVTKALVAFVVPTPRMCGDVSLLSILPDGLSDRELLQSQLPIKDVLAGKSVLLGTSLAYSDDRKRLKSLVPIREHMQKFHPPALTYQGSHPADHVNQITPNLGNVHQLLLQGLRDDNPDLEDNIACVLSFNSFTRAMGRGQIGLMDKIPALLQPKDHKLQTQSMLEHPIVDPNMLAAQAISHLKHVDDLAIHASFYRSLGNYYTHKNVPQGMHCLEEALTLAVSAGDVNEQAKTLNMMASYKWQLSEYTAGRTLVIEAQRLTQLSGNLQEEAHSLRVEAGFCSHLGDLPHCLHLLKRARERLRLCGMSGGSLDHAILIAEADTYALKSDYIQAHNIHALIAQNTSPEQDMIWHAYALLNLAQVDILLGVTGYDVERNLDSAKTLMSRIGFLRGVTESEMCLASLKLSEGDLCTAKAMFQKCLKWSWGRNADISTYCLEQMAEVIRWKATDFMWSTMYTVVYLAFAKKSQQKRALHRALQFLGDVSLLNRDEATAETLFIVALEGFTSMDVHRSRADCMLHLGDIRRNRGDFSGAQTLWKEARPLFERSLQAKEVAQIDTKLAAIKNNEGTSKFGAPHVLFEDLSDQD
ncbi:hypothetical protein K438DRAFT_1933714 [Mycena galopus ATCC 62051]|nr:hypothetical protein K438DRAFT_1933714 [Mycena galopus ATCC 62051]